MRALLEEIQPDEIYHLAFPSCLLDTEEFESDVLYLGITFIHRLLRWIADHSPRTRLFFASSSEIFGEPDCSPQNEETSASPCHPYAIAKNAGMRLVRCFREAKGVFACSGILYNHESPLRRDEFVSRRISLAVAEIAAGRRQKLELGNLDAIRDWSHAADFTRAMRLIMEADHPDDFILASGKGRTVREFCEAAFACAGLDAGNYVVSNPRLVREDRGMARIGDSTRAEVRLGWRRSRTFTDLVKELVEADLKRVAPQ